MWPTSCTTPMPPPAQASGWVSSRWMRRSREDPDPPELGRGGEMKRGGKWGWRREGSGDEEEGRRGETGRGKEDCGERVGPALLAPSPPRPSPAPPPTHATHGAEAATPPKPRETGARERTPAPDYPRWGVGRSRGPHGSRAERARLVAHGRAHRPPSCSRLKVRAALRQARASIKGFVVPAAPARGPVGVRGSVSHSRRPAHAWRNQAHSL